MNYRKNKRTGDRISEIGLGSSCIHEGGLSEGVKVLEKAYEGGINYFDLAAGDRKAFDIFASGLRGVRKNVFYQIHFGADYSKGEYGWSLDLETVKRSIDMQLSVLGTDYIDYGFIHCQDEHSDWITYQKNGILDYILELKKQGVVHHMGLSSHTPAVINEILDTSMADMLMFSIKPAYDYHHGEYANGSVDERAEIYARCEAEGVGITVMKPFSAGQLLDAKSSPFGKALTQHQCIKYALDRPGVIAVLPGAKNTREVEELLRYHSKTAEELDYSVISTFAPPDAEGKCVYCNHCMPCPAGLDISLINKYYDLAKSGDRLAREHYNSLETKAGDCIGCGHCDSRCPFGVRQSERMTEIADYFDNYSD